MVDSLAKQVEDEKMKVSMHIITYNIYIHCTG